MRSKRKIQLSSDLIELLEVLEKHSVRYMIIGGHAVAFHAEPRWTKDLDIWIATDKRNARAVFRALAEFGAPLKEYTAEDFQDNAWFSFGEPPNRVDILMATPGPTFKSAWPERVEAEIDGVPAIYVGRAGLVALKLAAGRKRDLDDLDALAESAAFAQAPLTRARAKRRKGVGTVKGRARKKAPPS